MPLLFASNKVGVSHVEVHMMLKPPPGYAPGIQTVWLWTDGIPEIRKKTADHKKSLKNSQ